MAGAGPAKTIPDAKNNLILSEQHKMKNYLPKLVGFHCARSL
jgi:hypothetical protein